MALRAFFRWLSGQAGYRRINYSDAEYFNTTANDARIATASRERPAPSIEQIRFVVASIQPVTAIDRRDRALIAFLLLSGARDDAVASMAIRYVDVVGRTVFQDARKVRTKNRKTITSHFFPIGDDIEAIVVEWIKYLRVELLFGPDDPLFPATRVALDNEGRFGPAGLDRKFWKNADAIRRIFRQRFEAAGLPYFNPHSIRKTLGRYGAANTLTQEAWAAWSANLGHESPDTTFRSYATVPAHRQAEIFEAFHKQEKIGGERNGAPDAAAIAWVLDHLRNSAA